MLCTNESQDSKASTVTTILSNVGRMANGVAVAGGKMSILPEQN
jgi:hypothetical protein